MLFLISGQVVRLSSGIFFGNFSNIFPLLFKITRLEKILLIPFKKRLLIFATENTAPIPTIFKNASTAVRQQVTPSKILKIATLYIPIFAERLRSIFFSFSKAIEILLFC